MLDQVAGAVADPVRRQILLMLRAGPMAAGQIADRFAITRPAISRHLRVLRESGLVRDEPVGRQRVYVLDAAKLAVLTEWVAQFAPVRDQHMDALETEVYRTREERQREAETGRQAHPHAAGH